MYMETREELKEKVMRYLILSSRTRRLNIATEIGRGDIKALNNKAQINFLLKSIMKFDNNTISEIIAKLK